MHYPPTIFRPSRSVLRLVVGILWCASFAGCGAEEKASGDKDPAPAGTTAGRSAPAQAAHVENWDAIYIGQSKVGYQSTTYQRGDDSVHIEAVLRLSFERSGQPITQQVKLTSEESLDGVPRRFRAETLSGPTPLVVEGTVDEGEMRVRSQSQGETAITWKDGGGGFFAVEQSLSRKPMKAGERRKVSSLFPMPGTVGVVENLLQAEDWEEVELLNGRRSLLKINVVTMVGQQSIESTAWVDQNGETLKSHFPGLNQISYRTDQARALAAGSGQLDLNALTVVSVLRPIPNAHRTREVVYELRLRDQDIQKVFPDGPTQSVEPIDDRSARVTVRSMRPGNSAGGSAESPPTDADLASNSMIQVDDPSIVRMAQQVAQDETEPWKVAVALEKLVHDSIRTKDFSQGFATAADVARDLQGDCTEHAVLLAAVCRARKVPARVVTGLVYAPSAQAFAFHMWNEVWVNDGWVPLDSTLGLGGIGAAHLRLAASDLSGAQTAMALLPVMRVLGQLQVQVQQVDGVPAGKQGS